MEQQIVTEILRKNERLLRKYLVLSASVVETLYRNKVITGSMKARLIRCNDADQLQIVTESLKFRGLQGMQRFLLTLKETGHRWMIDKILDTPIDFEKLERKQTETESSGDEQPQKKEFLLRKKQTRFAIDSAPTQDARPKPKKKSSKQDNDVTLDELMDFVKGFQKSTSLVRGDIKASELLQTPIPDPLAKGGKPYVSKSGAGNPIHEIQHVTSYFDTEQAAYDQSMSVLRQEEVAIGELLEQNRREQSNVVQNQVAMDQIRVLLREMHETASTLYAPMPDHDVSRARLSHINSVPWVKRH